MKTKLTTFAIIALGSVLLGCSEKAGTSPVSSVAINRYRFYSSGGGQYPREFLLDTQTGRLWLYIPDQANPTMVMYPVTFESIDKKLSLIPNEMATDVPITKSPKTNVRAPTPAELQYLREQGVDISKLPDKLEFDEGWQIPTNQTNRK